MCFFYRRESYGLSTVLVNLIQPELIKKDIAKAKIVDQCFKNGADVILDHHPHVVQPKKGLVVYSLVNFISMLPTYVHSFKAAGKRNYIVYPINYTMKNQGKQKDPYLTQAVYNKMQKIKAFGAIIGTKCFPISYCYQKPAKQFLILAAAGQVILLPLEYLD